MNQKRVFNASLIEQIQFYVYLLIDPRDKHVFYVGKGNGNRVFAHAHAALSETEANSKLDRIHQIIAEGLEVQYTILRHGLSEKEAYEIEAALIDYIGIATLDNLVQEHYGDERGKTSIGDIFARYDSGKITITEPAILITINRLYRRGMDAHSLYEATRGNWVIGEKTRAKAQYAFAVYQGVVREVYEILEWEHVDDPNPAIKIRNRWRFEGHIATGLRHYVNGSVVDYLTQGAQNPIRILNC